MYILAGDTTGSTSSVAVLQDDKVLVELNQFLGLTHSETFFPMIEDILKQARLSIRDIDLFTCTVGPGSFTGTRIGVTAMKTLAFVNEKALIGVDTLAALAQPITGRDQKVFVFAVLAARNRRLFAGTYRGCDTLKDARVVDASAWLDELYVVLGEDFTVHIVGDGISELTQEERDILVKNERVVLTESAFVSAAAIGHLAWEKYRQGARDDIPTFQPNYLVVTQAERTTGITYDTAVETGFTS